MQGYKFGATALLPQIAYRSFSGWGGRISVAPEIASVSAVATIGAPSFAGHVLHLFEEAVDQIEANGQAEVDIGGRPFTVGAEMVRDLKSRMTAEHIANLRCNLLILHSPLDSIVGIENAAEIFTHAKHPKSFVSLDTVNHLLTRAEDGAFAAEVIASWPRDACQR